MPTRCGPDSDDLSNAWGGPSLVGAWLIHGGAPLILLFVTPLVAKGLTGLQGRLLVRLIGADRD